MVIFCSLSLATLSILRHLCISKNYFDNEKLCLALLSGLIYDVHMYSSRCQCSELKQLPLWHRWDTSNSFIKNH